MAEFHIKAAHSLRLTLMGLHPYKEAKKDRKITETLTKLYTTICRQRNVWTKLRRMVHHRRSLRVGDHNQDVICFTI